MKKSLYILGLSTLLFACETDITDKVKTDIYDGTSLVSISGAISDDSSIATYIDIELSAPYLETGALEKVEGAIVELFENDSLVATLTEQSPGHYVQTSIMSVVGNAYHVSVEIPSSYGAVSGVWLSKPDVVNELFTPVGPMIQIHEDDSVYVIAGDTISYRDADSSFYSPYLAFNDPAGKGNYYWAKKMRQVSYYAPSGPFGPLTAVDTVYNDPKMIALFDDQQYVEGMQIGRFNLMGRPNTVHRDTVLSQRFETRSLSEDMYSYMNWLNSNVNNGGLFAVPYSPQIGNIYKENDTTAYGMGFVYATSIRFDSINMFHPY